LDLDLGIGEGEEIRDLKRSLAARGGGKRGESREVVVAGETGR
jgi:hypothetical protein